MSPAEEDQLAADAIALVMDMRDDLTTAHATVRHASKERLEQLVCVLAAMVDPNINMSVIAWWRHLSQERAQ